MAESIHRNLAEQRMTLRSAAFSVTAILAMSIAVGIAAPAGAVTYGFDCITNNLAGDCTIGEAQLSVDVTAGPLANQVTFTFNNVGAGASSIADVYFDDGTLLGISALRDADDSIVALGGLGSPGVDFSLGAAPPDLPGGNTVVPPFNVTAGFLADSDAPAQPNGVNPGEFLQIVFNLQAGKTLADTLSALALAGQPGGLRIGIHVQGFGSGGSESFINNPVPEPGTFALVAAGMLGLGIARRRRD
jgi:hypothetical protein